MTIHIVIVPDKTGYGNARAHRDPAFAFFSVKIPLKVHALKKNYHEVKEVEKKEENIRRCPALRKRREIDNMKTGELPYKLSCFCIKPFNMNGKCR
jgi:hypothetical protein